MRLPRAVSAGKLIHALEGLGYRVVRQKGSHVTCVTMGLPLTRFRFRGIIH